METKGRIKLRKNDTVKVIAGREKGKTGRIVTIDREKMRAVVEGLNMVKKAVKQKKQNQKGGITSVEAPLPVGKLMIMCKQVRPDPHRIPCRRKGKEAGVPQVRRGPVSKEKQGAEGAGKGAHEAPVKWAPKAPRRGRLPPRRRARRRRRHRGATRARRRKAKRAPKAPQGRQGTRPAKGGDAASRRRKPSPSPDPPGYKPRLKALYLETIAKDLKEEFATRASCRSRGSPRSS